LYLFGAFVESKKLADIRDYEKEEIRKAFSLRPINSIDPQLPAFLVPAKTSAVSDTDFHSKIPVILTKKRKIQENAEATPSSSGENLNKTSSSRTSEVKKDSNDSSTKSNQNVKTSPKSSPIVLPENRQTGAKYSNSAVTVSSALGALGMYQEDEVD
jgi:hypothetical protein